MGQLHIRLDDETKTEWSTYADEHGYGSLSRFVRVAVANERNGQHGTSHGSVGGDVSVSLPDDVARKPDVSKVGDKMLQVADRLERVEDRMKRMSESVVRVTDKRAVIEALPTKSPSEHDAVVADTETPQYTKDGSPELERSEAGVALDGRPASVAAVAEESVPAVRTFLAETAHYSEQIRVEVDGGHLRYWNAEDTNE